MQRKNKRVDVSIVTLNYKEAVLTIQCVQSLLQSKKVTFEVLIIDNSCSEKEARALQSIKDKKVKIFIAEKNLGCAGGYNYGIHKARGKYIFIVNNDTILPDSTALSKMMAYVKVHPKVGIVQPKIKSMGRRYKFEYAGAAGGFLDTLGYPFCKGRIFSTIEADRGQYNSAQEISWASTCAFFARKSVLYKAGLFDQIYFAYAEEVDISLKVWLLGYKVMYFPGTEIFHKGESSWKKTRGRKTYLIHRNHLILYLKCLPLRQVISNLPYRILLEYLSMVYYILHKSNLHIIFVLYSHIVVLFLLPKIIKRRIAFFKKRKKIPAPLYERSIVVDYFLRHKRHFSQLDGKNFKRNL